MADNVVAMSGRKDMSLSCIFKGHKWFAVRYPVTLNLTKRVCERCLREEIAVLTWLHTKNKKLKEKLSDPGTI